jgi:nucleotide-binding universal stress UspA family protein
LPGTTDSLALKRLLCATDFSDGAAAALEVAVVLARPFQAEIRIVHVRRAPVPSGSPIACLAHASGIEAKSPTDLMNDLDRCGQAALASGVATQSVLLHGDPSDQIVREAKHTAADIIVMGRHSQRASNPWILGSVAESVLRKAPCAVVVVRPFPRHRGQGPRHVLCGLDLGGTSEATLLYAIAVSKAFDADLQVLHVAADGGAERARSALATAVARASTATGPRIQASVVTGVPHEAILALAQQNDIDLVVVGSHGGGVVDRQFLGSTTLHLLRQAESPVLVVPAHVSETGNAAFSQSPLLRRHSASPCTASWKCSCTTTLRHRNSASTSSTSNAAGHES